MATSETLTREDLKNVLNKVLPSDHYIEGWEYVGLVNAIHWSSWTCPEDGMVVADIGLMTNGGVWYYYVNDTTDNFAVGKISGTNANGTSRTISFPVIKGHTYQQSAFQSVNGSALYFRYYKFVLKNSTVTPSEETTTIGDFTFTKKGTTVDVSGWGSMSVSSSAYQSIGTLPEAFRPNSQQFVIAVAGNSIGANAVMKILPSGDVSTLGSQTISNQFFAASGSYSLS